LILAGILLQCPTSLKPPWQFLKAFLDFRGRGGSPSAT
jgi:hypothetical protein